MQLGGCTLSQKSVRHLRVTPRRVNATMGGACPLRGRAPPASRSSPALRSVADAAAAISSGEVFCAILQVKKRVGREIILDGVEKMCGVKLLKLGEFGFCLIEDWDIGVGVFPEG